MNKGIKFITKAVCFTAGLTFFSCAQELPRVPSAADNVFVFDKGFKIASLNRFRNIRVYLPPDYQFGNNRYPVLYMHDGQNLFDDATSYAGEWGIDETLNRLHKEKGVSLIVVGIDNGEENRMTELAPWDNPDFGKSEAKQYMSFVINKIKPFIDENYRTMPASESTGIMGSSMGGLISHYAAFEHADTFSKIGVFSPSFWYSEKVYAFSDISKLRSSQKLFYMTGGNEGRSVVPDFNKMIDLLKNQGLTTSQLFSKIVSEGEHNEKLWRNEFEEAVLWLFN